VRRFRATLMAAILIVWGLGNIAFPLVRMIQQQDLQGSSWRDGALFGIGLTAIIAGLGLLAILERLVAIERSTADVDQIRM
jgi:hypothetical protein